MKKKFALIGAAGYIAPVHMRAIKDTGNELVAIIDPHDSIGIIDSYFPNASFFTEIERFDRHLEKLRRLGGNEKVNYISICSPNYLHDAHIRLALRVHANAICEKPIVINPWNLDVLSELEHEYNNKIYTIMQLRYLPLLINLKKQLDSSIHRNKVTIELNYITRRGKWYDISWKGREEKSGGIMMNIGIHFFDMLIWLFGKVLNSKVELLKRNKAAGNLELEWAEVKWFLSLDADDLPSECKANNKFAYRSLRVDGEDIDLSAGFTNLHTKAYEDILNGNGVGIIDARDAIELVYNVKHSQ